jgi:hypothetical protein
LKIETLVNGANRNIRGHCPRVAAFTRRAEPWGRAGEPRGASRGAPESRFRGSGGLRGASVHCVIRGHRDARRWFGRQRVESIRPGRTGSSARSVGGCPGSARSTRATLRLVFLAIAPCRGSDRLGLGVWWDVRHACTVAESLPGLHVQADEMATSAARRHRIAAVRIQRFDEQE